MNAVIPGNMVKYSTSEDTPKIRLDQNTYARRDEIKANNNNGNHLTGSVGGRHIPSTEAPPNSPWWLLYQSNMKGRFFRADTAR